MGHDRTTTAWRPKSTAAEAEAERQDLEGVQHASNAGIHRIKLPTPYPVGPVNVYLIDDEPLTLVDCGPASFAAYAELEQGITQLGYRLEDVGRIVLTHHHEDHSGLAQALRMRVGAELVAPGSTADVIEGWFEHVRAHDRWAHEMMARHGVDPEVIAATTVTDAYVRSWGASAEVDRRIELGEPLALRQRKLSFYERPGHSITDTAYLDVAAGVLITGDHLMAGISSNALLERPLGEISEHRPKSLVIYRDSLRRTQEMDVRVVLGGHRGAVTDHRQLIEHRLTELDLRSEKLLALLSDGPRSAHQLARVMWGEAGVTQIWLTLSEVLGHMDLLKLAGQVEELADDHVTVFAQRK